VLVQHFQITGQPTTNVAVRKEQRQHFSLRDDQVLELARYAVAIESHYSELAGHPRPMDIEWAMDGTDGKLYVVQARPETVHASAPTTSQTVYHLEGGADPYQDELLCFGRSIGSKVGVGKCVWVEGWECMFGAASFVWCSAEAPQCEQRSLSCPFHRSLLFTL
jgi:phosphoenolpyruvate synthase/pyruvate phosphate dikinase